MKSILIGCSAGLLVSSTALAYEPPQMAQCTLEQGYGLSVPSPAAAYTLFQDGGAEPLSSAWPALQPVQQTPVLYTRPPSADDARAALDKVYTLAEAGRYDDALLQLRIVDSVFPRLADRFAQQQGDYLLASGQAEAACKAYLEAADSLDRNVAARARVGYVRCGFAMGARDAEARLTRLLKRYPALPDRQPLRLLLGQHEEASGRLTRAIAIYRSIDLEDPSSIPAEDARKALAAMAARGVKVRALTPLEETDRAERLVRSGPIADAHRTVEELLAKERFPSKERARLYAMAARMARIEGRWDDAAQAVQKARLLGMAGPETAKLLPPEAPADSAEDPEKIREVGEQAVRAITHGRPMRRLRNMDLLHALRTATQYGLSETASEAVEAIAAREKLYPAARFDAALSAIGVASDASLVKLLATIVDVHRFRVSARYHYGRALERNGQLEEATAAYQRVMELDQSTTPYYSMWAEQRLRTIQKVPSVTPTVAEKPCKPTPGIVSRCHLQPAVAAATHVEPTAPTPPKPLGADPELRAQVLRKLSPLVEAHSEAYPWLPRAADLVRLDCYSEAADELNEAYLALRDAQGAARLRSGLEAVFSGEAPPRRADTWPLKRARLSLTMDERRDLSELSALLGDHGIALRFAGYNADARPRAYEAQVQAAAARYGVDPDLLFAVMRVESIYNRRIISHVGAIGLTQIMPRTGRLIADSLDIPDFEVTDLLDPQTNLNFSAWYLASLLRRFEGHIPLAVAAYNGGPHNVRLWLRKSPDSMPLDAFLEHIPFSQTHRYVRRVLTHYAAYRAQRSLPMPQLSVALPKATPDKMAF